MISINKDYKNGPLNNCCQQLNHAVISTVNETKKAMQLLVQMLYMSVCVSDRE